jgi:hypothetical protein
MNHFLPWGAALIVSLGYAGDIGDGAQPPGATAGPGASPQPTATPGQPNPGPVGMPTPGPATPSGTPTPTIEPPPRDPNAIALTYKPGLARPAGPKRIWRLTPSRYQATLAAVLRGAPVPGTGPFKLAKTNTRFLNYSDT